LYQRPRRRFTAEFIGAANFVSMTFDGQVWKTADGASVAIPGQTAAGAGETRQAVLRSEVLHVEATDVPLSVGYTALRGTVLGHQYMGPYTEYSIDVAGTAIMAHSSADFSVGSPVHVTFRPPDLHLLAPAA
jgi:ABC-type Fe3+/spermidine/putrescine transport system ATPase subunit